MKEKRATDEQIENIYHNNYIGLSESADTCGRKLGYVNGVPFSQRCRKLGLRLRTPAEAPQTIIGQPWVWDAPQPTPSGIGYSNGSGPGAGGQVTAVDRVTNLVRELLELGCTGQVQVSIDLTIHMNSAAEGDTGG